MRRPAFDLLTTAIGSDLAPVDLTLAAGRCTEQDWLELPELARHHNISLVAGELLKDVLPEGAKRPFIRTAAARRANQMRTLADLKQLAPMLAGEPWALLKGAVLADHVWSRRGLREYGDLDILVRPQTAGRIVQALEASGARLDTHNWRAMHEHNRAEIGLTLWRGGSLDLHWNLLGSPEATAGITFDTEKILSRTRLAEVGGGSTRVQVPIPDQADLLSHVAIHALLEGVSTLRHVIDIDQLLRHDPPTEDELLNRAEEQGTGLALAVVLQRTSRLRAASPLDEALARLAGHSAWRLAMKVNDLGNPLARSGRSLSKLLTASTSGSTAQSVSEFSRALAGRARRRGGPPQYPDWLLPVDDGYRERVLGPVPQRG